MFESLQKIVINLPTWVGRFRKSRGLHKNFMHLTHQIIINNIKLNIIELVIKLYQEF